MGVPLEAVSSSYVRALGHDADSNELHVQWPSGRVSIYSDVDAEHYEAIKSGESIGRAVIEVKKTKMHRYA